MIYLGKLGGFVKMQDVRDIAKWFLSKDYNKNPMTHKKLQKLCYYAQAWYCALHKRKEPLFKDEIQAWVHGPVIPTLYPIYADYGWEEIPKKEFDESIFDQDVIDILEAVYNTYGGLSGHQLESLTHSEEPWRQARGDLKPWESCTAPIPCDKMRSYYAAKYEKSQSD